MSDLPIKHIAGPIESLANKQMGFESTNDAALGFQMWGGKDDAGNVTKWLAKGKPGLLSTLQLSGLAGSGSGLVRYNANGEIFGSPFVADDLPPHNELDGLNDGEFQHLNTAEKALLHDPITLVAGTPLTLSGQTLGFDESQLTPVISAQITAPTLVELQALITSGVTVFYGGSSGGACTIPAGVLEFGTDSYFFVGNRSQYGFKFAGNTEFRFPSTGITGPHTVSLSGVVEMEGAEVNFTNTQSPVTIEKLSIITNSKISCNQNIHVETLSLGVRDLTWLTESSIVLFYQYLERTTGKLLSYLLADVTEESQEYWLRPAPTKLISEDGLSSAKLEEGGDGPVFNIEGCEISHGTPASPHEFSSGEGDSRPVQEAWHCELTDITGNTIINATDISAEYQSKEASTAGLFGGTTAGKVLIVGMDFPYQGVKVELATLGSLTPENLRLESWIGPSTFNTVKYMATDADNIWLMDSQKANNICTSLKEQWRFGFNPLAASNWSLQTLNINGVDITKYWGRFVIETDIVEDPQVEQMKAHTNHHEINKDGTEEDFGLARMDRVLVYGLPNTIPNRDIDPADYDILYGPNTRARVKDNRFANLSDDGFLVSQGIFHGLDTSIPILLKLNYMVIGTGVGDVLFDVDVFQVKVGFVHDGLASPDSSVRKIDTISVAGNLAERIVEIQLDAEKVRPGEKLMISIRRDSSSEPTLDTLADDIAFTDISLTGWFWR